MKVTKTILFSILPLALLTSGCTSTYTKRMNQVHAAYHVANYDAALAVTGGQVQKSEGTTSRNALLWRLEHATLLDAKGDFAAANAYWEIADDMFTQMWRSRLQGVADFTIGLLTPINKSTYYAAPHEGVMLYTYRMVDALRMGDVNEARIFMKRLMEYRDAVLEANAARVAKRNANEPASQTDEYTENEKDKDFLEKHQEDSSAILAKVEAERAQKMQELREDMRGYVNYANPLANFLTYVLLRSQGSGNTDDNEARREIDELFVFAPRNSVVRGLLENNGEVFDNGGLDNNVFVFFETGRAPRRVEKKLRMPVPTKYVSYVGIAWPELVPNVDYARQLTVSAQGQSAVNAELLANFDAITQQAFDDAWSSIISRQIAQGLLAAAINAGVNTATQAAAKNIKNDYVKIGVQIAAWLASMFISDTMIESDVRSWELLPKEVHVARLEIPADRVLTLSTDAWCETLALDDGVTLGVWVKTPGAFATPNISQFKFK